MIDWFCIAEFFCFGFWVFVKVLCVCVGVVGVWLCLVVCFVFGDSLGRRLGVIYYFFVIEV